jgi:hypothetical protein
MSVKIVDGNSQHEYLAQTKYYVDDGQTVALAERVSWRE